MLTELVLAHLPPLGGGGMAQASLLEPLLPYVAIGSLLLVVGGAAVSILRKLYRRPDGENDDAE